MKIPCVLSLPLLALAADSTARKRHWGTADGKEGRLFALSNKTGMEVEITNFGATVVSIKVPDRLGKVDDGNAALPGRATSSGFSQHGIETRPEVLLHDHLPIQRREVALPLIPTSNPQRSSDRA